MPVKHTPDRLNQIEMEEHGTVQQNDDCHLENNSPDEVPRTDKYEQSRPEYKELLNELADIQEDHVEQITTAKTGSKIVDYNAGPIFSAAHTPGRRGRQFVVSGVYWIL